MSATGAARRKGGNAATMRGGEGSIFASPADGEQARPLAMGLEELREGFQQALGTFMEVLNVSLFQTPAEALVNVGRVTIADDGWNYILLGVSKASRSAARAPPVTLLSLPPEHHAGVALPSTLHIPAARGHHGAVLLGCIASSS